MKIELIDFVEFDLDGERYEDPYQCTSCKLYLYAVRIDDTITCLMDSGQIRAAYSKNAEIIDTKGILSDLNEDRIEIDITDSSYFLGYDYQFTVLQKYPELENNLPKWWEICDTHWIKDLAPVSYAVYKFNSRVRIEDQLQIVYTILSKLGEVYSGLSKMQINFTNRSKFVNIQAYEEPLNEIIKYYIKETDRCYNAWNEIFEQLQMKVGEENVEAILNQLEEEDDW